MAHRRHSAHRLLILDPPRNNTVERTGPDRKNSVADRARLPGTENRSGLSPLRRPHLRRLAPPRHPRHRRPPVHHHPAAHPPKSTWGSLSLYGILRELQHLATVRTGYCPYCHQQAGPTKPSTTSGVTVEQDDSSESLARADAVECGVSDVRGASCDCGCAWRQRWTTGAVARGGTYRRDRAMVA
jgi:hypothetical protein